MTHRSFTQKPVDTPVLTFDLGGKRTVRPGHCPAGWEPPEGWTEDWSETFTVLPIVPAAALDAVVGSVVMNNGEVTGINRAQSVPVIHAALEPESATRFQRLLNDKDRLVDLGTLWDVTEWLLGEVYDRPTGGSGTSSTGA